MKVVVNTLIFFCPDWTEIQYKIKDRSQKKDEFVVRVHESGLSFNWTRKSLLDEFSVKYTKFLFNLSHRKGPNIERWSQYTTNTTRQ